jgi:serine/threonine protein kinase
VFSGANILLDKHGNAKLGDFGIVRELKINTAGSTAEPLNDLAGTVYWMAPEVFQLAHGRKADIW